MGGVFAKGSLYLFGPRGGSLVSPRSQVQPLWFQGARQPPCVLLVDPYSTFSRPGAAYRMGGSLELRIGEFNQGCERVCGIRC